MIKDELSPCIITSYTNFEQVFYNIEFNEGAPLLV